MLNFYDFIQTFVFTTNHHLNFCGSICSPDFIGYTKVSNDIFFETIKQLNIFFLVLFIQ